MAESALFSLASKLLSKIASSALKKAYERAQSIWGVREELDQLEETIGTIKAVLLDAEKKQEDSATVKNWISRVRSVLYEADDLFDEVATNYLLKEQTKGNKLLKEVRVAFSKLNPVISGDSIANKVKAIRKSLDQISRDMALFELEKCHGEEPISCVRKGLETRAFVDPKSIIGRDDDKKAVIESLLSESNVDEGVSVIAIVGIGGMGKTTLAQLIYDDEGVQKSFEKRWWACISDVSDEIEVVGKISQCISGGSHHGCDSKQVISQWVSGSTGNYLLVLDDVWDSNLSIWIDIISLLSKGVRGSKIIVTTRFLSVPRAMQKDRCQVYALGGLSEDKSWELFKMTAFTKEQEKDPNWNILGREIVNKCANVPLAIKSIASLLRTKPTMLEWMSVKDDKILSIGSIKSVLKLSYDHLPSCLKHCFAYCSLFPKDHTFYKKGLVNLWIAQGYVKPNSEKQTVEEVGHAYFTELLRRSFFQEAKERYGEIESCKVHDLLHDLAQEVAGEESIMLTHELNQFCKTVRHLSVAYEIDNSWRISSSLLDVSRLRSFIFVYGLSPSQVVPDQLLTKFKLLRALDLNNQRIEKIPSSIGELRHLRYLNLSGNFFTYLPDSITKLVNLLTLDISHCQELDVLPNDFRKLTNLRHLDTKRCRSLRHMPPGFEELTSLQCLSYFKVGKAIGSGKSCGLSVLAGLRGELEIKFEGRVDDWDGDQCWQLPSATRVLSIKNYPGMNIPNWAKQKDLPLLPNLVRLQISQSTTTKRLPPLRCLPYLKALELISLRQLEYIEEEDENECKQSVESTADSNMLFFPSLEDLALVGLPKLKGWSRQVMKSTTHLTHQNPSFPLLSTLKIFKCPELKSLPLSPRLEKLQLVAANEEMFQQLLPTSSSSYSSSISPSPLKSVRLHTNNWLRSFHGETLTSLQSLELRYCNSLRNLYLPPSQHNVLQKLDIDNCLELELWDEERRGVDWDSFPNLNLLILTNMSKPQHLPDCLQRRQALGKLEIWMQSENVEPDDATLLNLVSAVIELGALDHGKSIHGFAFRKQIKCSSFLGSALIDMYSKCGNIQTAFKVFQGVAESDRDVALWTTMITGFALHGHASKALELFSKMHKHVTPNNVTLVAILSACSHSGLVDEGLSIFNSMVEKYGIQPEREHFACVVDLLSRSGKVKDAVQVIKRMPMEAGGSIWGSLLSACKAPDDTEIAELASRELLKLDPEDEGGYLQLSNVYAASGKWRCSDEIRDAMENHGLKKTAGLSCLVV